MQVASPASLAAQAQAELVTQPLYDAKVVANAAASTIFFDGVNAADRRLSNVDQNGTLPHPKFFRIGGFRYYPAMNIVSAAQQSSDAGIEDFIALLQGGWYEFKIGDLKPYLQCPLFFIPAGLGLQYRGMSDITAAATEFAYSNNNGVAEFGNFLRIKHWISIPPLQSFRGTISWSGGGGGASVTTPTAIVLNASQRVWMFLDGEYGREVL